jgi:N-acetylmuramoyl-L-alanine amidase
MLKRLKTIFFIFSLFLFLNPGLLFGQELKNRFDKIVIDPGHGGIDLGAPGSVANEKDIVLSLALKVGKLIESNIQGLEVIYTRKSDRFVPLHKRAQIANENKADLFISIHCNSISDPGFFGSETYVMGIHKSEENLNVAKTENAAIFLEEDYDEKYDGFDPESDEDYIMLNMFQSSTLEESIQFSMMVQEKLKTTAGMYDLGVKQAGFVVLYLTTMPGALIETGFISNPAEEKYLLNPENQEKIARAIYEAVVEYKKFYEGLNKYGGDNE